MQAYMSIDASVDFALKNQTLKKNKKIKNQTLVRYRNCIVFQANTLSLCKRMANLH